MSNYNSLMERICRSAELSKEDVERKIEAKRAKLSGLISKEGAAQIVAAELGISFDGERMKISELVQGMRRASVVGQVTRVFPIREFNKNGREGKVCSFLLGDDSGNVRTVLWDVNHIGLFEDGKLKEGSVVEINNASVRNGELHLSGFSDIKESKEKIEGVQVERSYSDGKFKDANAGEGIKTRAVIVQTFEPRQFTSKKDGKPGVLLNVVLDDGTETMRAVMFGDVIKKLGLGDEELSSPEMFNVKKDDFLGEEKIFVGNYRMNAFFNRVEMNVEDIQEVNVKELIKELEAKA